MNFKVKGIFEKTFKTICFSLWVFCLHVYMCTTCLPGVKEGQKRASHPREMEWRVVVRWTVGAGNWTWIPCKSSKCFQPLSSLSSLQDLFFKLRNGPWGENYCLPWNTGGCTVLCFSIGVASGWSQHQTYSVANEHALPWRWSWSEGLWSSWGWALKFYSLDPLLILSLFPDYRGIHTHTTHIHRPHLTHTLSWNVGIWTQRLLRARQVLCHWTLSQSFLTLFEVEIGPHKLPSLASNFLILLTLTPELVTEVTSVCPSARL